MSLTNVTYVRRHLGLLNYSGGTVRNQLLRLVASAYSSLPHKNVVADSEKVKGVENDTPFSESITFSNTTENLNHQNLVSDSVVCASDDSLTRIYQENSDYTIDYDNGTISRCSDGQIPSGASVVVWYLYYRIYQSVTDYLINTASGSIKRVSGGSIAEGQEVLVDYELGASDFTDDEIEQAITEAESEINHLIDDSFRESTDPALQTAATTLALAYLCRNAAGGAIVNETDDETSTAWITLARSYEETARRLLKIFGRSQSNLHFPKLG